MIVAPPSKIINSACNRVLPICRPQHDNDEENFPNSKAMKKKETQHRNQIMWIKCPHAVVTLHRMFATGRKKMEISHSRWSTTSSFICDDKKYRFLVFVAVSRARGIAWSESERVTEREWALWAWNEKRKKCGRGSLFFFSFSLLRVYEWNLVALGHQQVCYK